LKIKRLHVSIYLLDGIKLLSNYWRTTGELLVNDFWRKGKHLYECSIGFIKLLSSYWRTTGELLENDFWRKGKHLYECSIYDDKIRDKGWVGSGKGKGDI